MSEINKLSEGIIGVAMHVLNALRPGLDEKLYENAMVVGLEKRGMTSEQQLSYNVHYESVLIGRLVPDLIVNRLIVVDTKVVSEFNDTHVSQMLGYLNITGLDVGLLLNFKHAKLGIKRVSRFANDT